MKELKIKKNKSWKNRNERKVQKKSFQMPAEGRLASKGRLEKVQNQEKKTLKDLRDWRNLRDFKTLKTLKILKTLKTFKFF